MKAGADAGGKRHLVGVDHRVAQPADMRDNRQRAVAHGAELRQAARLEARRHQQRIAAALDQMRQAFVIAKSARRRSSGFAAAAARRPASSERITRPEHDKLSAAAKQR